MSESLLADNRSQFNPILKTKRMKPKLRSVFAALAVSGMLFLPRASAQITNTVFTEDFSGPLNSSKLVPDSPMFEGGKGTIAAQVHDGVVEFTGTVTEQWWAGATLRVVPTFPASAETNVIVTVDRVMEYGGTTGSRSALWIMDDARTKYVLFADVNMEGGWHYNRKIGESGDVPTGGGNNIAKFDGELWDDLGQHQMKVIANGKTVKLYLDDVFGAEVKFPFSPITVQIGSYARANNDTAGTIFDNLKVENVGAEAFSTSSATIVSGQTLSDILVRIPPGVNKTEAVQVKVTTSNPGMVIPVGAVGDTLTLTFAAGASNEQAIQVKSIGPSGSAELTLSNTIGMSTANSLSVVVVEGFGVNLVDDFSGSSLDTTKWTNNPLGFETTGAGTFEMAQTSGQLVMSGTVDQYGYWPGLSIKTVNSYTATPALPLVVEIDRVSIDPNKLSDGTPSTGARTGVFLTTDDRTTYVFFGQNVGETGWQVNVSATGSGTAISQFSGVTDTGLHKMKLVANGSQVELFLDGVSGGKYNFAVTSGIHAEVGVYARDYDDSVKGVFDNAKIHHIVAPITIAPASAMIVKGDNTLEETVTISSFLNATAEAKVTVASSDPTVAIPEGATGGSLTLTFPAGGANTQSFKVQALKPGITTLTMTSEQGIAAANDVKITVVPPPAVVFSDNFDAATIDTTKWTIDSTPLVEGSTATPESGVSIVNGEVKIDVTSVYATDNDWVGFALYTKDTYSASQLSPIDFEIDRTKMEYVLTGGDASKERVGIWIKDSTTNYVFFTEFGSWNTVAGGWQYHRVIGQIGDNPITPLTDGGGIYMNVFNEAKYLDQKNHHMKVVADGSTVKLYVDGILGADVVFPFAQGIRFGFAAYANVGNAAGTTTRGFFDNAVIHNYPELPPELRLAITREANGDLVISWTSAGTLQSAASLPGVWTDVSPAPSGMSYTIPKAAQNQQQFYRLRQ